MFALFKSLFFDKRSPKWSDVRKEHIKYQPYCQACGRKEDLEVHHIIPVHKDPSKELDPNNLITLCGKTCHLMFGHLMDYKSWNPNVEEDSELYLSKIKMRPYHDKSN
jgi:5-methylcytosine-specific restriction endonuclease McrA